MRNFPLKIVLLIAVMIAVDLFSRAGAGEMLLQLGIVAVLTVRVRS